VILKRCLDFVIFEIGGRIKMRARIKHSDRFVTRNLLDITFVVCRRIDDSTFIRNVVTFYALRIGCSFSPAV